MTWFANCTLPSVDGVDVVLGKYVDGVDTVSKIVHTNDGEQFEYDRLLIATGTSPFIPDIPGARLPSVVGVRNIGDIEVVRKRIAESTQKRVILAGAGLVNTEIGDALVKIGIPMTYVISSDRVLSQIVDREASAIIEKSLAGLDVELLKGEDIVEIEEKGDALRVKLASGKVLSGCCVIYGKGVRPNIGFLKGTDVRAEQGYRSGTVPRDKRARYLWRGGRCRNRRHPARREYASRSLASRGRTGEPCCREHAWHESALPWRRP